MSIPEELWRRFQEGDPRALARALTLVESGHPAGRELLKRVRGKGRAKVVGVTGSPGAGKSTLTDRLILEARKRGERVAVLAVDPSSPFSGGAILGDRMFWNSIGNTGSVPRKALTPAQYASRFARVSASMRSTMPISISS